MYVVVKGFVDGKDEKGKMRMYKKGDVYKGERAKEFLKNGNVKAQSDMDLDDLHAVEKKIAERKAELSALEAQCKTLKAKLPEGKLEAGEKKEAGKEHAHGKEHGKK